MPAGESESLLTFGSAGSFEKQGEGILYVNFKNCRFDGGVVISAGTLSLFFSNVYANVTVDRGATFEMFGDVIGDVVNNGILDSTPNYHGMYEAFYDGDITGNYTQGPEGLLRVMLGLEGTLPATPLLSVSGTATLDGTLQFQYSGFVPSANYLEWVLHAHGGVVGTFAAWGTAGSPSPLFITGVLKYGPNDVWLEASRVSTQAVLSAGSISDKLTLASAARVDAAFAVGDALVAQPVAQLSSKQRQFLRSAGRVLQLDGLAQASRTFDSLSGHGHVEATDALLLRALGAGPAAAARVADVAPGSAAHWSLRNAMHAGTDGTVVDSGVAGQAHWLSNDLLLERSVSRSGGELAFDRAGGEASVQSSNWELTLRRNGSAGSYVLGSLGFGLGRLDLSREIDLGEGGRPVFADRAFASGHGYLEAGRDLRMGRTRWTPFGALNHAALRAGPVTEFGGSGFELTASTTTRQRLSADLGLRQATRWHWDGGWLQLDASATHRYRLAARDDMRAAFTGTPDASFDLFGLDRGRNASAISLGLSGGMRRASWRLDYDNTDGRSALSAGLELQLR